jgi:hypothetical protein
MFLSVDILWNMLDNGSKANVISCSRLICFTVTGYPIFEYIDDKLYKLQIAKQLDCHDCIRYEFKSCWYGVESLFFV